LNAAHYWARESCSQRPTLEIDGVPKGFVDPTIEAVKAALTYM
jgi:hypothetical protein